MSNPEPTTRRVNREFPKFLWFFVGLIALATAFHFLDRSEDSSLPTVGNPRGSGTAVFAQLLKEAGYTVRSDRDLLPDLKGADLVIRPLRPQRGQFVQESESFKRRWNQYLEQGGTGLELLFPPEPIRRLEPRERGQVPIVRFVGQNRPAFRIDPGEPGSEASYLWNESLASRTTLWEIDGFSPFAQWIPVGKGRFLYVRGPEFLANSRIDQHDHAALAVALVRNLIGPKGTILFAEGEVLGSQQPSLWQNLGAYAVAAYWQLVLLLAVVIYSVSRRFGPEVQESSVIRGTHELLGAFADLMSRAKRVDLALSMTYENLDYRVKRAINLPAHGDEKDRDERLEPELIQKLRRLRESCLDESLSPERAAKIAADAIQGVEELESRTRAKRFGT